MSDRRDGSRSRWMTVAVIAATLLVGSVLPLPFGRHPEFGRVGPDKVLHLLGHGAFAVALAAALGAGRRDRRAAALAVGLSTGYGLVLGRLQGRVPGRVGERADLVAGGLGSVLGGLCWLYLAERTSRRTDG